MNIEKVHHKTGFSGSLAVMGVLAGLFAYVLLSKMIVAHSLQRIQIFFLY